MTRTDGGVFATVLRFFKDSAVYGLGLGINKLVSFISLPIFTAMLTPADMGVLALLQVFAAILAIFLNAGVAQAIKRNFYDEATEEHRLAVVGTGLLWRLLTNAAILIALAAAARPVTGLLLGEATRANLLYYGFTLANVAAMSPQVIAYSLFRVRMQAKRNTAFSVVGSVLSLASTVVFLWWLDRGIRGALEAAIAANLVITLAMVPELLRSSTLRLRVDVLKGILSYGLPFLPHHLAIYLLFGADRYFLKYYWTDTEVGLYSYAYRIAMIMSLILEGASMAWTPFIFSMIGKENAKRIHALTGRYILTLIVGSGLALTLFGDGLVRLLALRSPEYWGAAVVVPWVIAGHIFLGMYQVFGAAVGIPKKSHMLLVYSSTGVVFNLVLNWFLIPGYGMIGAAIATAVAYCAMAAAAVMITQRVYPVPYEWSRIGVLLVAGVVCGAGGLILPDMGFWLTGAAKLGCLLLFPGLLWALGFFNQREREILAQVLRTRSE